MLQILFYIYLISTFVQIVFYILVIWVWKEIFFPKKETATTFQPSVSIIICGKNEERNIIKYLKKILEQKYSEFEVIFVNDNSTDNSIEVLKQLAYEHNNLKVINIDKNHEFSNKKGKKFALTLGIEKSKYDWILLTDADCFPNSDQWITNMVKPLEDQNIKIILGYGPYLYNGSFLSKLINYETTNTILTYITFCKFGIPYMGVGRNLLYEKNLFINNNGFEKNINIVSGDDDLLIKEIATNNNTAYVLNPNSWVYSEPKKEFIDYLNQKKRHLSVANNYKAKIKLYLGIIGISHIWHNLIFIILLILKFSTMFVLYIYISRLLFILLVYGMFFNRFHNIKIFLSLPLLDISFSLMNTIISPSIFFRNLFEWK